MRSKRESVDDVHCTECRRGWSDSEAGARRTEQLYRQAELRLSASIVARGCVVCLLVESGERRYSHLSRYTAQAYTYIPASVYTVCSRNLIWTI